MQTALQGVAAAASSVWAAHAAFASLDTPASQTMLSFLPTMVVSELSPQLLAATLLLIARGNFGDDAAVESALYSLQRLNLSGLTFNHAASLVTRIAALASLFPLISMANDIVFARDVFVKALRDASVTPRLTNTPLTIHRALISILPIHTWLRVGIESRTITYGFAPARVSRREKSESSAPPALKNLKLDLLWHREHLRRGPHGAPVLMYCHGGGWVVGSRKQHSVALLLAAAHAGWLVATIDYRLAPRVAFPNMLFDW